VHEKDPPVELDQLSATSGRNFQVIEDDSEKEMYLIIMVHGIGSDVKTQSQNKEDFDKAISTILKGCYLNSKYSFITQMIDWKTTIDSSEMRSRMKKC
jgi:hypothetical protein